MRLSSAFTRTLFAAPALIVFGAGCLPALGPVAPGPFLDPPSDPMVVPPPSQVAPGATFMIAAAGDIAGPGLGQRRTAALLIDLAKRNDLRAILALGDTQYPAGEVDDYERWYAPTWGIEPLKRLTRPVPGNHEYDQGRSDAEGYFDYFNGSGRAYGIAGLRGKGYYSFDMGDWHFIALNTSDGCRKVSCKPGSEMHRWLVDDLARTRQRCVLAYFHHPRFLMGGVHGDARAVAPLWDALYDSGADVVLAGHEHNFQALAPADKAGRPDSDHGIRSFVVGTGGADLYQSRARARQVAVVEQRQVAHIGVLELLLKPGGYSWRFVAVDGDQPLVTALGRDICRN